MSKLADAVEHEVHRPDFGLRAIIVFKCIKAALLLGLAIAAFALAHGDLHHAAAEVVHWLGIDPARPSVEHALAKLTGVSPRKVTIVGSGALMYAALMLLEAWGLHRRRVWAEWLTVIMTSSLIPFEIYELASHATLGKVIALIVNVAIVIYLLRHRWLFVPGRVGRWWKARRSRGV
jgi:uncharacterized membrane protein (DUF2068 family)